MCVYVYIYNYMIRHTTTLGVSLALRLESTLRDLNERGVFFFCVALG